MKLDPLVVGALLLGLALGMAVLAERVSPQDPIAQDRNLAMDPPGRFHPFGTDESGRDVLARVAHAGRFALFASVPASLLASLIALLAVRLSSAARGRARALAEATLDRLALIPAPALALIGAQVSVCDTPAALALLMGFTTWGPLAPRLRAASAAVVTDREGSVAGMAAAGAAHQTGTVCAATMAGHPGQRAVSAGPHTGGNVIRHTGLVLLHACVEAVRRIPLLLLIESGLSWLGLGLASPTPSWGTMIRQGARHFPDGWWAAAFPAVGLLGTVLAFRLTGEALRPPSLFHVTSDDRGSVQEDLRRVRDGER